MISELSKTDWSQEAPRERSQLRSMVDESHLGQATREMSRYGWVIGPHTALPMSMVFKGMGTQEQRRGLDWSDLLSV